MTDAIAIAGELKFELELELECLSDVAWRRGGERDDGGAFVGAPFLDNFISTKGITTKINLIWEISHEENFVNSRKAFVELTPSLKQD